MDADYERAKKRTCNFYRKIYITTQNRNQINKNPE